MPSRRIVVLVVAATVLVVAVPSAVAHAQEGAPAMPPVVVEGGGGAAAPAPAPDPNAPAPGAQPAAPAAVGGLPNVDVDAADPADVAADAAGIDPNVAVEEVEVGGDAVVEPIAEVDDAPVEVDITPAPIAAPAAPMPTVDGGGTDGAAAGGANAAPPVAYQPSGTLPFTGTTQSLLLAVLAGMFVPIGILLYSAARHGDLRRRRRLLSMPRFQWSSTSHLDGAGALVPRQELEAFDWTGSAAREPAPTLARLG